MIIKKIQLKNWQKHIDLALNFVDDVNVISGLSNTGKSSIRRAIDWVCFNANISENDYRTEGTSETSVKIWLDNDFVIERIRSNSINRYILSKEGCEDRLFDKFGSDIPEEIQQVLQVNEIEIENEKINLNIAEQLTLPFLLDKPASFRAKLFNKLTGNELLDKLFKECNKENLHISKEIKETEQNITSQEENLALYSEKYKNLKNKLNTIKEQYDKLKEDIAIYENLKELSSKIKTNKENKDFIDFKVSQIKTVAEEKIASIKTKIESFKKIQELSYEIEAINEDIEKIAFQKSKIKTTDVNFNNIILNAKLLESLHNHNINLCKINQVINDIDKEKKTKTASIDFTYSLDRCEELKKLNESLKKVKELNKIISENESNEKNISKQINDLKSLYDSTEKELREVWEKCNVCPLCGKENDKCQEKTKQ